MQAVHYLRHWRSAERGCTAVGVDASEAYLAGARH